MAAAVEVEERSLGSSGLDIVLCLRFGQSLGSTVEAIHICLVVLGVVELHNLTGNMRLESGIVIYSEQPIAQSS